MLLAAALTATLAAGCVAGGSSSGGPASGNALGGLGPQSIGSVVLWSAAVGHTYRFAFPELSNTSSTPLTIVSYRWATVPAGVRVGAVHVYSTDDSQGIQLAYRDGQDDGVGLAHWHDYAGQPMVLQPGEQSVLYAMISARVVAVGTGEFTGCVVTYRQGGRLYSQTLHCSYALKFRPAPTPVD